MKKRNLILIICFVLSLGVPTFFWVKDYFTSYKASIDSSVLSEYSSFQNLIIGFWSLIINIFLVVLADKAFKNFDVKKQFHNKQLDIVSELAISISSLQLSYGLYKMSPPDSSGKKHQILEADKASFFEIALGLGRDYSKYDIMVIRSNNIENIFPFLIYKNHPLLPKSISDELKKIYRPLRFYSYLNKEDLKTKNYVSIFVNEKSENNDLNINHVYNFYETPSDFTKDVTSLRKSIMKWYEKYGADDLNI